MWDDIYIIISAILCYNILETTKSAPIAIMIEIAAIAALAVSFKVVRATRPYIGSIYRPPSGKYVIINGCTDGIGKQYALHFAKNNTPLVLIARNHDKLQHFQK